MLTSAFIEKVMYLSLWSRRGRGLANEEKQWGYQFACDVFNTLVDIEGSRLTYSYLEPYTPSSAYRVFDYIDTTNNKTLPGFISVESVTANVNGQNYNLAYLGLSEFMSTVNTVSGSGNTPLFWTWFGDYRAVGIYPKGLGNGIYSIIGKKKAAVITVSYDSTNAKYIFTPETLDLSSELNYYQYLAYKVAQEMCIESNAPFSAEKEKKLVELEARLKNNNVPNISFKKRPAELTLGDNAACFNGRGNIFRM